MVSAFGDLNGSGNQQVWVETHLSSQSQGGNYSQYYGELRYYGNGWGSWTNSTQYWGCDFGGHQPSGTFTIPQSQAGWTYTTLYTGYYNRGHDGNGYGSAFNVRGSIDTNHSSIGDGNAYTTEGAPPRIAKVPGKPPKPIFSAVSATTIDYTFTSPSDNGGSGISSYTHQSATDSGFTQNVQTWTDNGSPGQAAGLTPGTPHWIRFRANNAIGSGPYSDALAQTTLPAVPPGMTVTATPSGTGASIALTPPGGVSGVTEYIVERRDTGTTAPVTTLASPTSPVAATGLTPGTVYDWRVGGGHRQLHLAVDGLGHGHPAQPEHLPGRLLRRRHRRQAGHRLRLDRHGGQLDLPGHRQGRHRLGGRRLHQRGWVRLPDHRRLSPARTRRAWRSPPTPPLPGAYTAGIGVQPCVLLAEVSRGTSYFGSMYVNPSRDQRMRLAMLLARRRWCVAVGRSAAGAEVLVPGGVWTRLTRHGIAPANGELALSSGSATWRAPGSLRSRLASSCCMDAAMVTLSEPVRRTSTATPRTPRSTTYEWEGTRGRLRVLAHHPVTDRPQRPARRPGLPAAAARHLARPPSPPTALTRWASGGGTGRRSRRSVISDWLAVIPTITITTGRDRWSAAPRRQVRIRVYENPDNLNPDTIDATDLDQRADRLVHSAVHH